ncbi:MAG: POTRA domain-containing protein, partial [Dysgonamonadaceae bacterium]
MLKKIFYFAIILSAFFRVTSLAQTTLLIPDEQASAKDTIPTDTTTPAPQVVPSSSETNTDTIPVINYTATPKEYIIADIKVTGIENTMYEDQSFVLIGFSGLSKGDRIQVPGEEITHAVERFWKQGLFSDVKILANKIKGDSIWLEIRLTDRPRISDIRYVGMKKGEQEDIEKKLGMVRGNQITPNQINSAKVIIKKYFEEKGFGDAEVTIIERPDESNKNQVILEIIVDKKEKLGVHQIKIEGNKAVSDKKLKGAMKKTNEKKLANLFKTKKFV